MPQDDNRPLSPHLQVYDLPLTAKLSITHRITGFGLFIGLFLMIMVLASAAAGAEIWQIMHSFLVSWLGKLVLIGFTISLYFHLFNGIRHLLWDIGIGFEKNETALANKVVLIASVVASLLIWLSV